MPLPDAIMVDVGALAAGQSRDVLVAEVSRSLAALADGATVVVGASGGPDSAALLLLIAEARPDLRVTAVHVRHGLRDDAADLDAFGAQIVRIGVQSRVVEVDVVLAGEGLEAAARDARHGALHRVAAEVGASALLLGHTADDQAETVLMRLARGAGARGLAGMAPWRSSDEGVDVGRPLLRLRRHDVHAVLGDLPVVADPSNVDPRFARSHLRASVLPLLADHAGDPVGAISRAADLLRQDADALDAWAAEVIARAVVRFGPVHAVPDEILVTLPAAVANRVVRQAAHACGVESEAATVGALLDLAPGQAWDASGLTASRGGGWLALAAKDALDAAVLASGEDGVELPPVGLSVEVAPGIRLAAAAPDGPADGWCVPPGGRVERGSLVLDAPSAASLVVRTRRPGDRIRTAGGARSVQDLFVDAGVPRLVRDLVPLLVDRDGAVVWVPGLDADPAMVSAGRAAAALRVSLDVG